MRRIVKKVEPLSNDSTILMLDFDGRDSLIWIILHAMNFIWERRKCSKSITLEECRENLRADATILLDTKHANTAVMILCQISL